MTRPTTLLLTLLAACYTAHAEDAAKNAAPQPAAATKKAPEPVAAEKKEWSLFDGKSLDDWENVDIGASGMVELEGGLMIINAGDSVSGAVYKKSSQFADDELRDELRCEAARWGGFLCRSDLPSG
ncbi:MAG: hypothetical protein IPK32_02555 [Verrucomicrobiaceae bacterium]|nr:hypothetical protein [Verrucomicrobiaceae bacterium]